MNSQARATFIGIFILTSLLNAVDRLFQLQNVIFHCVETVPILFMHFDNPYTDT